MAKAPAKKPARKAAPKKRTSSAAKKPAAKKRAAPKKKAAPKGEAGLTPKQELFAQLVAGGMGGSDAYRQAYKAENMTDAAIAVEAFKSIRHPKIALRLNEIRQAMVAHIVWEKQESISVLADIARDIERDAKHSDRVSAVKELNAMHGFNAPQKIQVGRDLEPIKDESWL